MLWSTIILALKGKGAAFWFLTPLLLLFFLPTTQSSVVIAHINRLVEVDGVQYAFGISEAVQGEAEGVPVAARYNPSGDSWLRVEEAPETAVSDAAEPVELPLTRCIPDDPLICYRIEGEEEILESDDGGESWGTAWKVPAGRRLFMSRAAVIDKGRINMGPFDLLVSEAGEGHQVVAALGNEGVVRRRADGEWERQPVLNADPTPYRATTLLEILVTIPTELGGWLIFVVIYGIGQYIYFLRRIRFIFPPLTTAFLIFMTGGLILAYRILNTGQVYEWGLLLLVTAVYLGPIYFAYRKWKDEVYKMDKPEKAERGGWYWFWSTVGLYFGGLLLLSLWPLGLIPFYWLMVVLVLGTAVGVAWWGSSRIHVLMSEAGGW